MQQRYFIPGDQWLYYKLYTGNMSADKILLQNLQALIEKLFQEKIIDQWFFIRYNDPEFHLRIRFHLIDNQQEINNVIRQMFENLKDLVNQKIIWKVQIDTYKRELERYQLSRYEKTEAIFTADSFMFLELLPYIFGSEQATQRWLIALKKIDGFLDIVFNKKLDAKLNFIKTMADNFAGEFKMDKTLRKQINEKFKANFETIHSLLNNQFDPPEILQIIDKYHRQIAKILQDEQLNHQTTGGFVHMMMNRMFPSENRKQELVIYQFLFLYYRRLMAQQKHLKR